MAINPTRQGFGKGRVDRFLVTCVHAIHRVLEVLPRCAREDLRSDAFRRYINQCESAGPHSM